MSTKRKAENLLKFLQAALNQKELLDSILQNKYICTYYKIDKVNKKDSGLVVS